MEDKIIEMAFSDKSRWERALEKGIGKGICKKDIRELCEDNTRVAMYLAIRDGRYTIVPPHTAQIPKDDGTFRTVYVNEPKDRVLLSLVNDLLFELMPEMIHKSCKSYQKGISCGKIVQQLSREIVVCESYAGRVGFKADLSKYFDSVPIEYIDAAFDAVERKYGKSALIDVVRNYYHCDYYFDENNQLQQKYQSLKQGCAVAAWLADVVLFDVDEKLSSMDGIYIRYSDDIIFVGNDYQKAMCGLADGINEMSMRLNPKKVEYIDKDHWVKFLGFSIKGADISLSSTGIKKFQKMIEEATIKKRDVSYESALHAVYRGLYKGFNDFSWATRVLRTINVPHDVIVLNGFVMVMPTLYNRPSKLEDRKQFIPHQCKEWQDAYKGYGAFFSMQNLIRFHRCVFFENRKRMTKEASLKKLDSMAAKEAGWYLLGALKQLIVDNKIDIEAKQKEWKEKKLANRK